MIGVDVVFPMRSLRCNRVLRTGVLALQFADELLHGALAFLGWIGEIDFCPPANILREEGI